LSLILGLHGNSACHAKNYQKNDSGGYSGYCG
jgi:hypothetical protein